MADFKNWGEKPEAGEQRPPLKDRKERDFFFPAGMPTILTLPQCIAIYKVHTQRSII